MRYVRAKCVEDEERLYYREYVTESMRMRGEDKYPAARWIEIIEPKAVDERSGDEIAASVIRGAGLIYEG